MICWCSVLKLDPRQVTRVHKALHSQDFFYTYYEIEEWCFLVKARWGPWRWSRDLILPWKVEFQQGLGVLRLEFEQEERYLVKSLCLVAGSTVLCLVWLIVIMMVLNNDDTFSRCIEWLPSFFFPWTGEQIRHHGTTGFFILSAPWAPILCFWYIFGAAVSEEQIPQTAVSVSMVPCVGGKLCGGTAHTGTADQCLLLVIQSSAWSLVSC